ncbi:tetratricopeptide repeat-containing sensor histidine kinase [Pseudochryseolinea flava]|uniref:histidine kinase n=1 Tax=Pseudochryseolinea flava TaxID=2059302 RepID=A0A364Y5T3_9BACT|nr:tetratricopeptide repeat protein [Pseudochryseolinea flava]RAW02348.1 hypothetical protein DQQ10_07390 [Pseudochryseolinea flava]
MNRRLVFLFFLVCVAGHGYCQRQSIKSADFDSLISVYEQTVAADPQLVSKLCTQMIAFGDQERDVKFQAYGNYWYGKSIRFYDVPKKALPYLEKCVTLFESLNDQRGLCLGLKELGVVHYLSGDHTHAMKFYSDALVLANKFNLQIEKSALNNNIGNLYDEQGHSEKAISYYEEALRLNPEKRYKVPFLQNIAKAKVDLKQYDAAIARYRESIAVSTELKDSQGVSAGYDGMALVYFSQGKYAESLENSFAALKIHKASSWMTGQIETLNRIGLCYLNLSQASHAIDNFQHALRLAQKNQYANQHLINANLAFAFEQLNDYRRAYNHFVAFKTREDSLEAIGKAEAMEELLAKYEADKQAQKIVLLQREKELQDLKLHKQESALEKSRLTRDLILLAALLIIVLFVVLLILYRQRMRNRIQAGERTEALNRQRTLELIREHEMKTIIANIEGRDKERLRISQELHDGVAGSLAGIKLQIRKVSDTLQTPDLEKIIRNVDSVYDEVRMISHNLSPYKVLNTAFIDLIKSHLKQVSEDANLEMDFITHPEEKLNKLPDQIKIEVFRIIQELMVNIVRHARAKSVEVQFTMNDESINLIVEDSGKGFDVEKVNYGVGLNSIRRRVTDIQGTLHIESVPGRGTIVNIDIPLE